MKKLLLCTTALVSIAGSALASDWNVTFSGNNRFEAGVRKFSGDTSDTLNNAPLTANQKSTAFFSTSKVSINVTNKMDDVTYGASIRMQVATNQSNGTDRESRMDRSHIFMDSNFGSIQLGTNVAASKLLNVNAGTIASATGGVDGSYTKYLGLSNVNGTHSIADQSVVASGVNNSDFFITSLDTLSNRKDGAIESAEKITYLSPRVEGLQLGVSYTPDLSNGGNSLNRTSNPNPTYLSNNNTVRLKNIWSLALNYRNTFANDVNVELAATGNFGKSGAPKNDSLTLGQATVFNAVVDTPATATAAATYVVPTSTTAVSTVPTLTANARPSNANLRSYTFGALVEKNGISAVLSYSIDGKSSAPTNAKGQNFKSSWWNGGVVYANGPMSTSLTFLTGKRGYDTKLKTQAISLGGDYEIVAGFKPFAEVTYAVYKNADNDDTNKSIKATVFILGTRVKF